MAKDSALDKLKQSVDEETGNTDEVGTNVTGDDEVVDWHEIRFALNQWSDVLDTVTEGYRPVRETSVPTGLVPAAATRSIPFTETVRKVRIYNRTGGDITRAYAPNTANAGSYVIHNDTAKEDDVVTDTISIYNPQGTAITINDAAIPTLIIEAGA